MSLYSNNHFLKVLSFFLIVIIFSNNLNSALYTHSHKLKDGTTVVHAHPYNSQNETGKQHSHSNEELIVLQIFSQIFAFIIFILFILILNQARKSIEFVFDGFRRSIPRIFSNRAPPRLV